MTEEQQKSINACKDQAAKEIQEPCGFNYDNYDAIRIDIAEGNMNEYEASRRIDTLLTRAMQLYGEQCRKKGYDEGQSEMQYNQESNQH